MPTLSSYPPGVSGREPEINGDMAWEYLHEGIDHDATDNAMTDQDVAMAWSMGLAVWLEAKKYGAQWPHER